MTNEERSHLSEKLADINPIPINVHIQRLQAVWPWRKGLVSDRKRVGIFSSATVLVVMSLMFFPEAWLGFWSAMAVHALALVAFFLVLYALSDNGLVRLFCPARRALEELLWTDTYRVWATDFNQQLLELQAKEEQILVGFNVEWYQKLVAELKRRRQDRLKNIDTVAEKLAQSRAAWEQDLARGVISDALGENDAKRLLGEEEKK